MKSLIFWFKFHCGSNYQKVNIGSGNGLATNMRPEQLQIKFCEAIWRHCVTMSYLTKPPQFSHTLHGLNKLRLSPLLSEKRPSDSNSVGYVHYRKYGTSLSLHQIKYAGLKPSVENIGAVCQSIVQITVHDQANIQYPKTPRSVDNEIKAILTDTVHLFCARFVVAIL